MTFLRHFNTYKDKNIHLADARPKQLAGFVQPEVQKPSDPINSDIKQKTLTPERLEPNDVHQLANSFLTVQHYWTE